MYGRRGRWLFLFVLLGGLAGFSGLWYATSGTSGSVDPAYGGAYVEGVAGTPARVNPLFANQNDVDEALTSLVFSGLTRLDEDGQPFPDLAETWTISPDGRVYTIRLRPGLVWQDGAPVTANDVLFTYGLVKLPAVRSTQALGGVLADAEVTKTDDQTIAIALSRPYAPLPSYLTLGILPSHLLANAAPESLYDAPFNLQPVGTGAYRVEELTPQRAVLTANPTYHLGQPFIQRLELRFYRDEGVLLAALKQGVVDGALFSNLIGSDRVFVASNNGLALQTLVTPEITYVYFNLSAPIFSDRRVRQALLHAIDRGALARETLKDVSQRVDSMVPVASWAYTPALSRYGFDPKVMALLLDEAGWRMGASGTRTRVGQELALRLSTNTDPVRLAVANELAAYWREAGVRVTVDAVGATALVREVIEPRSFEALLFSGSAEPDPDPFSAWHSSQAGARGLNLAGLRDQRFDSLLEEGRASVSTPRRQEVYGSFQELFAQDVPSIPLYGRSMLYVLPESMRGVRVSFLPDAGARFWQVQEWHLRTR